MKVNASKEQSLLIILIIYIISIPIGFIGFKYTPINNFYIKWFMSDLFSTVFVWLTTIIFTNTSIYDPYWSVAPPVYYSIFLFVHFKNFESTELRVESTKLYSKFLFPPMMIAYLSKLLVFAIVWIWGIRLTVNWVTDFTSLLHQDWRYLKFKNSCPFIIWHIINFFGLQFVPTLIVFLAMLPGYETMNFTFDSKILNSFIHLISKDKKSIQYDTINMSIYLFYFVLIFLLLLGAILSIIGILLEHYGDTQLREFRKNKENKGKVCDKGLWSYTRHPNYLGEILMWWGIYFMASPILILITITAKTDENLNDSFIGKFDLGLYKNWPIGAIANTLLFLCVSIPLMEERQLKNKPEYAEYKKKTGMLLPKLF